jgi:Flp pilus assembly pilin Flp
LSRGREWRKLRTSIASVHSGSTGIELTDFLCNVWRQDEGQDVAEYAVMLAVILAIAIGTIRLIGSHAGDVFASVGSAIQ